MTLPDYQSFMLPVLKFAADGCERRVRDAVEGVADMLQISDEDKQEMLPSGTQTRLYNRVGWSVTYLHKAGLLNKPQRGWFKITESGQSLLRSNPEKIDNSTLEEYESFRQFKSKKNDTAESREQQDQQDNDTASTPEERIEQSIVELNKSLMDEISDSLSTVDPGRFEQIVVDLLVAMGYGGSRADASQVIGKPGDGGIDGTIKEDRLGLDVVYVQAKRWQGPVGRKEIQSFAGSLEGERASKGVFITTSTYSKQAEEYVNNIGKRIILIDGDRLARLMIDHGVGVTEVRSYSVCKLDSDYYEDN